MVRVGQKQDGEDTEDGETGAHPGILQLPNSGVRPVSAFVLSIRSRRRRLDRVVQGPGRRRQECSNS